MTSDDFRRLALELPGTQEKSHMRHPDFRKDGKIFATLSYPNEEWAMVKVPPEEQQVLIEARPKAFVPVKGAWGRQGCTNVRLKTVDADILRHALKLAWSNTVARSAKTRSTRRRASDF
jgi:hypothetical protein